jgi:hypothetical protein
MSGGDGNLQGDESGSNDGDLTQSEASIAAEPPPVHPCRTRSEYERLFGELPSWFKQRDADLDGQVMMSEYASQWTDALAEQFSRLDPNGDGVITAKECADAPSMGSIASNVLSRMVEPPSSSSSDESTPSEAEDGSAPLAEEPATPQEKRRQMWGKLYSSKRPGQP